MLKFYDTVLRKVSAVLVAVSCTILILLAAFMMVDIFMRYVLKSPILGDVEIVEVVMAIIVFATFAYTQTEKGHIHVTMVIEKLPRKLGVAIYAFNSILVAIAAGAVTVGIFQQGGYVLDKGTMSAIIHIPYYPFYYISSVLMGVFTIVLLADAAINVIAIFNKTYEERVTENWS